MAVGMKGDENKMLKMGGDGYEIFYRVILCKLHINSPKSNSIRRR